MSRTKALVVAALAALAAPGCSATVDDPAPGRTVDVDPAAPSSSTLTVRWSLAGSLDPKACDESLAETTEISVVDLNGRQVGTFEAECSTFTTSVTLSPGTYAGSATLIDGDGQLRTVDVLIDTFTLTANDELVLAVDFPPDSFLE